MATINRTKLVVGNWKMNMTNAESAAAVETFLRHVSARPNVDVVLCPPYLSIARVHELVRNSHVKVGAQDVFWEEKGAFTGKVSVRMITECGASYCIVGHSETRGRFGKADVPETTLPLFGESDETVNLKIRSLLYHSANPILCVGETEAERTAGQTEAIIAKQLEGALVQVDPSELYFFSVAYEPVWAIGTGKTCETEEANRVCGYIREKLAALLDENVAAEIRILYGGSVKPSNSAELFGQSNIDGGLVGGASLDPMEFSRIVMSA
jgi:triosephosphate isomerase